jgi:hypothetical protein
MPKKLMRKMWDEEVTNSKGRAEWDTSSAAGLQRLYFFIKATSCKRIKITMVSSSGEGVE